MYAAGTFIGVSESQLLDKNKLRAMMSEINKLFQDDSTESLGDKKDKESQEKLRKKFVDIDNKVNDTK